MRLVIDTDVLIASLRSDQGASRQILLSALDRRIIVLASVPLMLEYEAVLTRPEQLNACDLTLQDAAAVLDAFAAVIEPATCDSIGGRGCRIQQTKMVLETAVNGLADRLATFNVRHIAEATRFREARRYAL